MRMKYTGQGAYVIGVPARDMTMDEWESLPDAARESATAAGLYEQQTGAEAEADMLADWPDIIDVEEDDE